MSNQHQQLHRAGWLPRPQNGEKTVHTPDVAALTHISIYNWHAKHLPELAPLTFPLHNAAADPECIWC